MPELSKGRKAKGANHTAEVQHSGEEGRSAWQSALWLAGGVAGAVTLGNALLFKLSPPPSHAVGGYFDRYPARHGDIAYAVQGTGSPVLLLHGFGAGNSMAEWSAVVEELALHHTVYALDFPGWGLSDKTKMRHSAHDYIELIASFLSDVVKEPCALVGSSHSCALAIEVAQRKPEAVSKLVLVCPNTVKGGSEQAAQQAAVRAVLKVPGLSTAFYNALCSRSSLEKFMREHLFFDSSLASPARVDRFYAAAHQDDATFAAYSFFEGSLDFDARASWGRIEQPALLIWGRNARIVPLDAAPEWLANKPDAKLHVVDQAKLLPHVEHPAQWSGAVLGFLDS